MTCPASAGIDLNRCTVPANLDARRTTAGGKRVRLRCADDEVATVGRLFLGLTAPEAVPGWTDAYRLADHVPDLAEKLGRSGPTDGRISRGSTTWIPGDGTPSTEAVPSWPGRFGRLIQP